MVIMQKIDKNGNYIDSVMTKEGIPVMYNFGNYEPIELKDGETIVELPMPSEVKPRINQERNGWTETATADEIEEHKKQQCEDMGLPYPPENYISEEKRRQLETETALMELAEMLADTQAALLEIGGINNG